MKLLISREDLLKLISKVQSIVPSKPAIPVLANILLEASNDELIISATDLTVSVKVFGEAKVEQEGSITVPARRFFQLVRELTASQVEIDCSHEDIAHVHCGSSHFKLNGMHRSEFPNLPAFNESKELLINSEKFKEALMRTSFAAARDDSRHVLNGVLLHLKENALIFVGTDGKRLAKITLEAEVPATEFHEFILPLKGVEEIQKLLEEETQIKLFLMKDKIAVEFDRITLISKLLSGQFPDVDKVIPHRESLTAIALHREELISLLRQISLFTSEMASSVRFVFHDGELHLFANSSEIGEGTVSMPVDYSGPKIEIAFNPFYFLDILRHCKDETVQFYLSDSFNPGLLTDSTSAIFVIMPMRIAAASEYQHAS
ncbi:MAG: DNA polymerase III subunit beta [Simkaniaceae bacterium]